MLYDYHFLGGSADSASARTESSSARDPVRQAPRQRQRRTLSLWGLGAAAGLLSLPLRAWSSEPESVSGEPDPDPGPDPDPAELAGELCPVPTGDGSLDLLAEACDSDSAEAASSSPEPALLTVLGSDVRLEDLVLPQAPAPESSAASGGLFGLSWPVLAIAGGGGVLAIAVLASGGSDDGGGSSGNREPMLADDAPATLSAMEGEAMTWDASDWFSDPGDTFTYTAPGRPSWLGLDEATGSLTIAAGATDDAEVGSHTVVITATDAAEATAVHTLTLTVANVNDAPTMTTLAMASLTVDEGASATWTLATWFSDPDPEDTLTVTAPDGPSWLVLDAMTGELTIAEGATDDAQVGSHVFTITATDGDGETAVHTLTLTVEDVPEPPIVTTFALADETAMEGEAADWDVSAWFSDPDGDMLTFAATLQSPGTETAMATALAESSWLAFDAITGSLTIAAEATDDAEVGVHVLVLTATDDSAEMARVTHLVRLTITDDPDDGMVTNAAPALTAEALQTLTAVEEAAADWAISAWFSDQDEGDVLTFAATLQSPGSAEAEVLPSWLVLDGGSLTIAADATDDTEVGFYTLVLTATDDGPPDEGGMKSITHTVTLTITDDPTDGTVTNFAPILTAAAPETLTAMEEVAAAWDVSGWFLDLNEGDTLAYTATLQRAGTAEAEALPDWLVLDAMTGTLTIASGATDDSEVGVYTLEVVATDDADEPASVTHTVTLAITDDPDDGIVAVTNSAPVTTTLAETSLTVDEGAAETWDVSEWFDDPDGDTLTYTAMDLPDWLELDSNGELGIEAESTDDDDVDSHVFVITATDGDDESATLTVTLEVENVNAAPVLTDEAPTAMAPLTAMEGVAASWTLSDWFEDPDGDTLTYAATGNPTWLSFDATKGELTIAAEATDDAEVGSHTFTVTATDGDESLVLTATLTVENDPEDPTVAADAPATLTVLEGSATATNWTVSTWFSDPDLAAPGDIDSLTYAATGLPEWLTFTSGVLTIAARATDDSEIGTYTLAVTATDEADAMVTHMATLEITDTENEPVLSAALSSQIAPATGMTLTLDLADFFTDTDEAGDLTFAFSESIPGTGDANIITAMLTGAMMNMLELTPGTGTIVDALWQQETVTLTATDSDDKQAVAEFAVTTRANVLDTSALAPAHGFIIQGDVADDNLGESVSGAGDVNGDGLDDLIVGAWLGDDKATNAGEAYIVYGKANPAAGGAGTQFGDLDSTAAMRQVVDTTSLGPTDGFIIQGHTGGDALGSSVAGAGDINGDGLSDLIVGALNGDARGSSAGEAYIIYGKAGTAGTQFGMDVTTGEMVRQVVDTTNLKPIDGFVIQGEIRENLGSSVSGVGDVNGDGVGDLVVSAILNDCRESGQVERAYIIYGKLDADGDGSQFGTERGERQVLNTGQVQGDLRDLTPADGFIIQADMVEDELGWSVSGAGDVNGDGLADLVVGAPEGEDGGGMAGEAYIVYGKAVDDDTYFGTAMTIVVSATDSSVTMTISEGQAVPDGFVESEVVINNRLNMRNLKPADGFILQGDRGGDELGYSVSGAGDINGDGYDDLIAGARFGNDGGGDAGEAYIIYGKADPADEAKAGTQFGTTDTGGAMRQVLDTSMLAPAAGFIIQGDAEGDQLGRSVSGAGDVNGDGLADLIVGAYFGDDGTSNAGEAYILYGKAGTDGTQFGTAVEVDFVTNDGMTIMLERQVLDMTDLGPTDGFIIQGGAMSDNLGVSVSGAGDVNGDGFDDLIAGAWKGDDGAGTGMTDAGEAYVVFGGTHLGEVVSHDQTLVGGAVPTLADDPTAEAIEAAERAPFLLGGAGDDRLEAHADTEVLYGGAGDDVLSLADGDFRRVDGGSGSDTLVLGMDVALDFTEASDRGRVRGIETLSLSDGAEVSLDLLSVYALVESRDNGGTHTDPGEAFLRLEGSSGTVSLSDASSWTIETDAEGTADLYAQASARLLIDDGLGVA